MNWKPLAQIFACLAALFVLGGVCGYSLSSRAATRPEAKPASGGTWASRWVERCMAEDLVAIQPTPEQEAKLRPIYGLLLDDLEAIQRDSATRVGEALRKRGRQVAEFLTPEQVAALQETHQRRRSAAQSATSHTRP